MTDDSSTETISVVPEEVHLCKGDRVGEYVIQSKLGKGGFGTVYKAEHPVIGKLVAIKVLHSKYSGDPEMVSRFVSEARAVNQINHRNIVDIFGFDELDDGRQYCVMEYLPGWTLDQHLTARGRLEIGEAIAILRDIAKALDAAHRKGIAHRDLKPDNILLAEQEDQSVLPKLLDFGIAKLLKDTAGLGHKTQTGAPLGTPAYMSPEQARGREIDHRTDIYSFGAMVYELLTGELLFMGEDYFEVISAHAHTEPTPPSERAPELLAELDQPILWMLEKNPDKRPSNLVSALLALERAAREAGLEVPDAPPPSGVFGQQSALASDRLAMAATEAVDSSAPTEREISLRDSKPGDRVSETKKETHVRGPAAPIGSAPIWPWVAVAAGVVVVTGSVLLLRGNEAGDEQPVAVHQAAPRQPPEPTAEPKPQLVSVAVEGAPRGAEIYGPSGKFLGAAPGIIQVRRGDETLFLQIRADGYLPRGYPIVPARDLELKVELEPEPSKPAPGEKTGNGQPTSDVPPGNTRGELEDPFDK